MGKPQKSKKKVTSVWLESERTKGGGYKLKMFNCPNCRIPVVQYQGEVIRILPGNHPYTPKTVLKCKGSTKDEFGVWRECNTYYSFMGVVNNSKDSEE